MRLLKFSPKKKKKIDDGDFAEESKKILNNEFLFILFIIQNKLEVSRNSLFSIFLNFNYAVQFLDSKQALYHHFNVKILSEMFIIILK